MIKWLFGLSMSKKDKMTLSLLGVTDLEIERVEKAGYSIIKRSAVITSIIALTVGIIAGQIF